MKRARLRWIYQAVLFAVAVDTVGPDDLVVPSHHRHLLLCAGNLWTHRPRQPGAAPASGVWWPARLHNQPRRIHGNSISYKHHQRQHGQDSNASGTGAHADDSLPLVRFASGNHLPLL